MGRTLDDFVRARVEEDVRRARGLARRSDRGGEDWVAAVIEALDRRDLVERATSADSDERFEYADEIRRRLAALYRSHSNYREDYCA